MTFFTGWLTVFIVGCLAVMSPGPDLAMTIRNSLTYSRQAGIRTAVGLAAGNCVHATYCLLGVGVIISRSILLFNAIKWFGAIYLIYIGIKSLQAKQQDASSMYMRNAQIIGRLVAIRMGFLTNLLNPKATLFFLALFTQIVQPSTSLLAQAVYGLTIVWIEFTWFAFIAILISQQRIQRRFLSISHWIERTMGLVLIALGLRLAFENGGN
jgi:RhtB (resistance to homoserine/threonine) family protein